MDNSHIAVGGKNQRLYAVELAGKRQVSLQYVMERDIHCYEFK